MAQLNVKPGSSSARQHQRLVMLGRDRGIDLAELRSMVGGSLRKLSAAEASDWITQLSGAGLPHPPGEKPVPPRRRKEAGVVRMITPDQVEQIGRLLNDCFPTPRARMTWLHKNFKVQHVHLLGTAKRAGEVIRVLKLMLERQSPPLQGAL